MPTEAFPKLGRNPLESLKPRPSSKHLHNPDPRQAKKSRSLLDKVKKLKIEIDWVQFYEQVVPKSLKKITSLFIRAK